MIVNESFGFPENVGFAISPLGGQIGSVATRYQSLNDFLNSHKSETRSRVYIINEFGRSGFHLADIKGYSESADCDVKMPLYRPFAKFVFEKKEPEASS